MTGGTCSGWQGGRQLELGRWLKAGGPVAGGRWLELELNGRRQVAGEVAGGRWL